MKEQPIRTIVVTPEPTPTPRLLWVLPALLFLFGNGLAWVLGPGGDATPTLAPRTVSVSTNSLCFLAVLGAAGVAWSIYWSLPAAYRLLTGGKAGRIIPCLGSVSALILCWSLWEFEGALSSYVLLGAFALTDGAVLLTELWSITGGALLRALLRPRRAT